jgi:hypothetical protein
VSQIAKLAPPPHDLDAEASVLSAVMIAPERLPEVACIVLPAHFYSTANQKIAEVVWSLAHDREAIDVTTVGSRLKAEGRLHEIGGSPYLSQIIDATPSVVHVADHARIVAGYWSVRQLQAECRAITAEIAGGNTDATPLLRRLRSKIEQLEALNGETDSPSGIPSVEEPLRGLKFLGPLALIGRDRLVALASRAISYVWMDIVVAGIIVVIAGAPGDGKTTILFLILVARLNTGAPVAVLGRIVIPAPSGKFVVLIEGEHSESSTARKLRRSMALLEVDEDALDRIIVIARKAVLLGSVEWADVVKLIRAGLVSDIALDTLSRVAPGDSNDEREQVAIFNLIAAAIESAPEASEKPVAWVVAHTKKNGAGGDLADVSGSVQRTGQADTVLMVKGERCDGRIVSTRVTFAKLREDPDDYPMPVSFSIVKDERGAPLLRIGGPPADDNRPLEARVVDALRSGPKTKNSLSTLLARSAVDIERALTTLFGEKAIRTVEVKIGGRPFRAFEIRSGGEKSGAPAPAEWDSGFDEMPRRVAPDEHPTRGGHPTSTRRAPDETRNG